MRALESKALEALRRARRACGKTLRCDAEASARDARIMQSLIATSAGQIVRAAIVALVEPPITAVAKCYNTPTGPFRSMR
mmetsp:Transcript_8883/g.23312  ORF Transcript_8883/g.23312 Transcript_8883/m.23312 type:complete len:80 (-) Transcript_8883:759-998(-)